MIRTGIRLLLGICVMVLSLNINAKVYFLPLNESMNVSLDGDWLFYPNVLSTDLSVHEPTLVQLPNSFENLTGQVSGHGTFVQNFQIPEQAVGQILAFSIPYQYGAYELYVDDALILRTGQVGDPFHHQTIMAPKLRTYVAKKSTFKITLRVSSYQHIRGGLENSMWLGYDANIRNQFYRNLIMTTWVSGMLIMISLFIVLFSFYRMIQNKKNSALLFLGLFILCFSLRSFFAVPFPYTLFTNISWLWGTRLEYLLTELICLFFMTYLHQALPYLLHRYVYWFLSFIIVLNIGVTLTQTPIFFQSIFFKTFSLSLFLFANMLYGVYRIYRDKISFSWLNTVAILVVCATFIHDYLLGLNVIDSVEIAFYTSCIYFMIVTFNLSRDYAIQSEHAKSYNSELLQLNQTLDDQVRERTQHIEQLNLQLSMQLRRDALTGAYNRYALNQEIQQRYEQAIQNQQSLAFLMIDVDYFKNYNDAYGHLKGDDILRQLVEILSQTLPDHAFLARYGGEEFAIILSAVNLTEVGLVAEKCLQQIRNAHMMHEHRPDKKRWITVSIGGAVMDEKHLYQDIISLMRTADSQLYKAKAQRDCTCVV